MKKIFLSAIVAAAAALPTFAAVDTLNYSAVVRNAQGEPIANQEVSLMFQFVENDNVLFDETVKVTTSAAGVVNYAIGSTKSLDGIDWTSNNIKLAVSMDVNGGTDFAPVANSEVASVPTALYALKSADTENLYNDIDDLYGKMQRNETVQNDIFAKISAAEEDIDNLYGQNERTQAQLNNIAADFANLGENLDNSFAQVTALEDRVDGLVENLDNSFKRVEAMEEQVDTNTTAIAEVKKDAYDAFEDIYKQLGDLEELANAVEVLDAWHRDNDETILSLPATLNAMNENIEENTLKLEEMEKANAELVATLQTLDNLGNENADAIEDLYGKLERNQTVQNDIFAKISAAEEDIEAINGKLERNQTVQNDIFAKISAAEEDIDNLYGQNERTQSQLNNIAADFANLGENLDNSFAEVTALEERVDGLVENLDNSFKRVEVMEEDVETLVNTLTDYIEQDQIVSGKVESMEGTVNYLREENEANVADINALQEADQRFQTVQNDIFDKITKAEEDIDTLYGKAEKTESDFSKVAADFTNLGENLDNLVKEMTEANLDQDRVIENLTMFAEQTNAKFEEYDGYFEELGQITQEIETIKEQLLGLGTVESKVNELTEAIEAQNALDARWKDELNAGLFDLTDNVEKNTDDIAHLYDQIDRLNTQITELQNQVAKNHPADDVTE